jgi:asparagine synthase (glutamine-hydrolysing)
MFLLSSLVRDCGYKVVLTGEGADEFLGGYDIFKEAKVRRFWAREPASTRRPLLFQRLYRDIPGFANGNRAFLAAFFQDGLTDLDAPCYSHFIRWRNNRRTCRFLSQRMLNESPGRAHSFLDQVAIPERFSRWNPLERAQYLEITIFMSEYLLSSQGDRVAMAHSVEGRFPFLDCRLVEYCNQLPASLKLRGLTEKYLLKQCAKKWLPDAIWQRPKRPYRAPIHRSFFNDATPEYVSDLLSPESLRETGLFTPVAVGRLVDKLKRGAAVGETDDMALAGILSSQLVHFHFVKHFRKPPPLDERDDVKVCGRMTVPLPT